VESPFIHKFYRIILVFNLFICFFSLTLVALIFFLDWYIRRQYANHREDFNDDIYMVDANERERRRAAFVERVLQKLKKVPYSDVLMPK